MAKCRFAAALVGLIVAAFWLVGVSRAALADEPPGGDVYVDAIRVHGLDRTEIFVVRRELLVDEEQVASIARIEESIQRIRNTGLFRTVDYELVPLADEPPGDEPAADEPAADEPAGEGPPDKVTLEITVDEKWTALPIFSFARGGGTYQLVVGAFDDNFLGRFIGVGGQYVRLGDANSFYGWLHHPRLFGERLLGAIDVGTRNRIYTLFDDSGQVDGGFLLDRFTIGGTLQKEWLWWLRTQASLRWVDDDFSLDLLSPPIESLQRARGLPSSSHALVGALSVSVGRIDQDNYLLDGSRLSLTVEHANDALGSSHTLTKLLAGLSHYERLPWKSNVALRAALGTSQVDAIHHRFYLGGLDALRGFASDRFSGEHYWLANAEFRIPSIDTRWFVLQHIFFADAASAADEFAQVARLDGLSAGVGLRIIVPKIHGFIARVDYAFSVAGDATNPLSLGGGQFY